MTDTSVKTFQGRVKWFNPKAGYGFITLLNTETEMEDVFVHHSGLSPKKECFKTLYQGEYVSLSIKTDESGKNFGTSVTGISGNELMCERFADSSSAGGAPQRDSNWSTVNRRRDDRRDDRRGGRAGPRDDGRHYDRDDRRNTRQYERHGDDSQ
mgnify:FL=1